MLEVSIIVPNYNHTQFLTQRIDSILNQSFQDFELIILDDFSTDDSKSIIELYRYHPKTAHIVYNEKNSGSPFLQWQKGFALAKGEFIWIAESDDFAEPNFLEITIKAFNKSKSIGLVYTDSNIIVDDIKANTFKDRNSGYLIGLNWEIDHLVKGIEELERHLIENCTIYNVSSVLFKKEALQTAVDDISYFKFAGDWVCYMLIALNYDIYYLAESLNNYRSHGKNLTKKSGFNYLALIERIKARDFVTKRIKPAHFQLIKKLRKINLIELRAVVGGFLRGKIKPISFYKVLKYYF